MGNQIVVRVATIDDVPGIARVKVLGWQAAYKGFLPQGYLNAMSIEEFTERGRKWNWGAQHIRHWVCIEDGRIVGWASAFFPSSDRDAVDDVGSIVACYAVPEVWGTGVGHQLMQALEQWLRQKGASTATLWLLQGNQRAQAFYRRQGFEFDGATKEDSLGSNVTLNLARMRRVLSA